MLYLTFRINTFLNRVLAEGIHDNYYILFTYCLKMDYKLVILISKDRSHEYIALINFLSWDINLFQWRDILNLGIFYCFLIKVLNLEEPSFPFTS